VTCKTINTTQATRRGLLGWLLAETTLCAQRQEPAIANEFFALDTALVKNLAKDVLQESDIQRLAALGYAGLAPVVPNAAAWQRLTERILPWLDAQKLKLHAVYSGVQVARDGYTYDPEIKRNLASLKGRGSRAGSGGPGGTAGSGGLLVSACGKPHGTGVGCRPHRGQGRARERRSDLQSVSLAPYGRARLHGAHAEIGAPAAVPGDD
jgi:hypothetical protein